MNARITDQDNDLNEYSVGKRVQQSDNDPLPEVIWLL